jgi:hypothetical protein
MLDNTIKVTVPLDVPVQRVADTLCAALEGGVNYWCRKQEPFDYPAGAEWGHEAIAQGAEFRFWVHEEAREKRPALTIKEALEKMAAYHPDHFWDLIDETEDAETGDVLFQLICFGELVYG